jgi:hypothetical protein
MNTRIERNRLSVVGRVGWTLKPGLCDACAETVRWVLRAGKPGYGRGVASSRDLGPNTRRTTEQGSVTDWNKDGRLAVSTRGIP